MHAALALGREDICLLPRPFLFSTSVRTLAVSLVQLANRLAGINGFPGRPMPSRRRGLGTAALVALHESLEDRDDFVRAAVRNRNVQKRLTRLPRIGVNLPQKLMPSWVAINFPMIGNCAT